jgi:hypothetical protein
MARVRRSSGNGQLEQALATLINNQASFVAQLRDTDRINSERFARIEAMFMEHSRILAEHGRILAELVRMMHALPEAVRDKIGFKMPERPAAGS